MKTKLLLFSLLILVSAGGASPQVNNARMLSTPNAQTGTTYTFAAADTTRVTTFNNASPVAVTLPNGATAGFGGGTMLSVMNLGAGQVTITCSSCTINGAATLVLSQNSGADIYGGSGSLAVNYIALPSPTGTSFAGVGANNAFTGNNTHSGTETFTGPSTLGLLNNACWIDGTKYTSIAAANADTTNCRVIVVPPKPSGARYTETLAANFTASSILQGIIFLTDAAITMGTNTFAVPSTATSDGFFLWSPFALGYGNSNVAGVRFIYTGASTAMTIGGTTQRNFNFHVEGISVDITGANTAAQGWQFNNLFNSRIVGNMTACNTSGTNTQVGMFFDGSGTPGFSDLVALTDNRNVSCQKPMVLTNANGYVIQGGATEINCGNTTGGVGLTISGAGNGSTFAVWPDLESCPTLGADVGNSNNKLFLRVENLGGGKAAQFESGVVDNDVMTDTPQTVCTDLSTNTRNQCSDIGGSSWPSLATPDIFPTGATAGQVGRWATVSPVMGSGSAKGYGQIGLCRAVLDVAGDRCNAGWFTAKSGGVGGANEFALHAEVADSGGTALEIGQTGSNFLRVQPGTFAANRTVTVSDPLGNVNMPFTIASGTASMTTALIAAGACGTTVTVAATGVATTDVIDSDFNAAVTAANNGLLIFHKWPTAGNVNFNYCNPGAAGVTPTAMTVNWSVKRP